MSNDHDTTVQQLKDLMQRFVHERDWEKFHTAKNLATSVAIESAELLELFQWQSVEASHERSLNDESLREQIADEMSDVLLYLLSLSNALKIDVAESAQRKLIKNALKYPAP